MTTIISYEKTSPSVLANTIERCVPNALPMFEYLDEDYFEMTVLGWLPLSPSELAQVENILAPFV